MEQSRAEQMSWRTINHQCEHMACTPISWLVPFICVLCVLWTNHVMTSPDAMLHDSHSWMMKASLIGTSVCQIRCSCSRARISSISFGSLSPRWSQNAQGLTGQFQPTFSSWLQGLHTTIVHPSYWKTFWTLRSLPFIPSPRYLLDT